jgi:hypothetical protein
MSSGLIESSTPGSILGRLEGQRVPFSLATPIEESTGAVGGWIGDGYRQKPVATLAFSETTLLPSIAAVIVVITEDLARLSRPGAALRVSSILGRRIAYFIDSEFCDPLSPKSSRRHSRPCRRSACRRRTYRRS